MVTFKFAAMVVAEQHFTQVYGAAFGRNRPQDICQIFIAEGRGPLQLPNSTSISM